MTESAKSYFRMRREFYRKYKEIIVSAVQKFDTSRKRKLITAIIVSGIFFILATANIIFFLICVSKVHDASLKSYEGLLKITLYYTDYLICLGFG